MKRIIAVILLFTILLLNGCWDAREINELGLVMAVGIDKAPDSDNYIVTVQIANAKMSNEQSGTSGGAAMEPVYVITAEGTSLYDATRQLTKVSSKRIMWAHNYIVIIGEDVARDSIAPVVDFFTHNPELRMKTVVVVSRGEAKKYLTVKTGMEDITGISFQNIYSYAYLTAEYIETDLLGLCQDYYSENSQPLISVISFKESKLPLGSKESDKLEDQVEFGGAAVFEKEKLLGWLTPEETKGIALVMNEARDTLATVKAPSAGGKSVSVELQSISANVEPNVADGKPSVAITISGAGKIVEEDAPSGLTINALKKEVKGLVEEYIVNTVNKSLQKIQKEFKADVLKLARHIHAMYNKQWENGIKQHWKDVYPQMPVTVRAEIDISSSSLYQLPEQEIKKD